MPHHHRETMTPAPLRAASMLLALVTLAPFAAGAAPKPFTGPASGWDHTVNATPTADAPRSQETWRKSDGEIITFYSDAGLAFDDMIGMIKKNITDNGFKPSMDVDRKCDGRRAHEVEMTLGTSVVHQVVIDDAPGVTKLTYLRPQGSPAGADVRSALAAYCGAP
jgi:hypothetical protein